MLASNGMGVVGVWGALEMETGGEAGIGGVRLTLTGTTGSGETVVRSTVTAADGSYLFDALPPGTYQVSVDAENFDPAGALSGFQPSPIGQGTDAALDSNASPTGTEIGLPVFETGMPRRRPSDEPSAIVRTTPSPSCCWTSKVRPGSASESPASCSTSAS